MNSAKIGTALLSGYVLGRTKKAKLAIGLGALLAGSRIKPGQVAKNLQDSPFLSTLTNQVRTELTDASKAAATSVLTAKADSLAEALHERTTGLREKAHVPGDRGETAETEEDETAETDEESRDESGQDEDEEAAEGREKTQRRKSSQGKKKASTAQGRSRSDASRSRRPDDG